MGVLKARVGGSWVPVTQGYSSATAGYVAHAEGPTTNYGSIGTSATPITGMSVTVQMIAGHRYLISGQIQMYQESSAPQALVAEIQLNSVQWRQAIGYAPTNSNSSLPLQVTGVYAASSTGPMTWRMCGQTTGGTCAYDGRFGRVGWLLVEDITQVQPADTSLVGAWTPVTFQNAWLDLGGGYQTCQYRKIGDIVYLRGVAKSGSSGTVAFTLPVGYRPPLALEIASMGATVFARFAVNPDGTVIFYGSPNFWLVGSFSVTA